MIIGLVFGTLNAVKGNMFGAMTGIMAFICGLITLLTNK